MKAGIWLIGFAIAAGCQGALAEASTDMTADTMVHSNRLGMDTERVVVFKDGYSLVVKRGVATTDEWGEIIWNEVPDAAVLGSFWATPQEGRLVGMVAGWVEESTHETVSTTCLEIIEVLQANRGRTCTLELVDGARLTGSIKAVLTEEVAEETSVAVDSLPVSSADRLSAIGSVSSGIPVADQRRVVGRIHGSNFVLRTDEGDVLLAASQVRRLTIEDMRTTLPRTVTTERRSKRLTLRFAEPHQRREVIIAYFRPGLRWIPTYRIDLPGGESTKETARITIQAELINEAEDLVDTPIDLVVGVPNFRFRDLPSPLILEQTLRNALQQAAPQLMGQFRNDLSNALFTQRAGEFRGSPAAPEGAPSSAVELPAELTAEAARELFVYHLPRFSLRKGERAALPISTTEAPYRDVYTLDVHLRRDDIATSAAGAGAVSPLKLSRNRVWRQIDLTNTGSAPWTTGTALLMRDGLPLAQELLTYTAPRGICRVPVTVAIDLRSEPTTTEIDRQLQAMTWHGSRYAKIQLETLLEVTSFKPETIALEISLRFGGRAEQASDDGVISLAPYHEDDWDHYQGSPAVNNSSTVRWDVRLQPGESFNPRVGYSFYARH